MSTDASWQPVTITVCLCTFQLLETRGRFSSASSSSLIVRRTRLTTDGDRAFPVAAVPVWNDLYHASVATSPLYSLCEFSAIVWGPTFATITFLPFCSACEVTSAIIGHFRVALLLSYTYRAYFQLHARLLSTCATQILVQTPSNLSGTSWPVRIVEESRRTTKWDWMTSTRGQGSSSITWLRQLSTFPCWHRIAAMPLVCVMSTASVSDHIHNSSYSLHCRLVMLHSQWWCWYYYYYYYYY